MKKNVVIMIVVLFSTMAFAGGINDPVTGLAVINKVGTKTYNVFYRNSEATDVTISIYNSKNKVIYTDKVKNTEGFTRPYNFAELADDEYTFQVEDNLGIKKEKISYHSEKTKNLFNVIKLAEADKYLVTSPQLNNQTITLKIYNNSGEIVYNESAQLDQAFAKVYKLNKVEGAVTFEVTDSAGVSKVLTF